MKLLRLTILAIGFCLLTIVAVSQVETQVPFDTDGNVMMITKSLNNKLSIFDAPQSFMEARLFRTSDSTYVLEISRMNSGELQRERKPLTSADVKALRIRAGIVSAVGSDGEERAVGAGELDQRGRGALLWGSTLWSLFYYGSAASYVFGNGRDYEPSAATYLIAGGLGYLLPALLTRNANVTEGAASLALGGMFQGAIHGWLLAGLIQGDNVDAKVGFGLSIATGIAETVGGYVVGSDTKITEGKASVINTTEFYGSVVGGLLGITILGFETNSDATVRLGSGLALAGAAGGIVLGNLLGNEQYFSPTDATVYGTAGLLGLTLPYAILLAAREGEIDGRLVSGLGIVGVAGGLIAGNELVKGLNYRGSDGTGIVLGTLAGALIGVGIGVLAEDTRVAIITTWLGAAGGFVTGLAMAKPSVEGRSTGSLKFDFNPLSLVLGARSTVPLPVGSLTYRF